MDCSWNDYEPLYRDLEARRLTAANIEPFLSRWSALTVSVDESRIRLYVATTRNTADQIAEQDYRIFLEEIYPRWQEAEQKIKLKLIGSGLKHSSFELPLRRIEEEAALFRDVNVPILAEEETLAQRYNRIIGAQTVKWEQKEVPLAELNRVYEDKDRGRRELAWRLCAQRRLADREAINALWKQFLTLRLQLATNAGHSNYVSFRWRQLLRLDYAPADARRFHGAVEDVVLPAIACLHDARRKELGVEVLRPWDLDVDPLGRAPLRPFGSIDELCSTTASVFHSLDAGLGSYFATMLNQGLLDLDSREHKAPGGYCETFPAAKVPFIFMNATGVHADVQTILHESGHAFHIFEVQDLPYYRQRQLEQVGLEFAEVASMAMELLAAPYLTAECGGFYSAEDAVRARVQHLQRALLLWAGVAAVDAFQHWVYENPLTASDPSKCDESFATLWRRFTPGVDWTGLEQELNVIWHQIAHIHLVPFYMIEYGLAQMGAVQIMTNALHDQEETLANYRRALSLGATRSLSDLYSSAGAKLAFDSGTLGRAVGAIENTIAALESLSG